jgi:hypothetical protein
MGELQSKEVGIMESRKWLWVVIGCLAIVTVYQIAKLTGGISTDSPSPETEPSLQPDQRTTHTASLVELPGTLDEKKPPVIEPAEMEEPQEPSTVTTESSAPSPERQETEERVGTVAMQELPSPVSEQPEIDTIQAPPANVPVVKTANRGFVHGIVLSEGHGSALIDGMVVQTGTIIDDVKVVNIHAGGVEFEKESQRWTQKVGAAPDVKWH